MQFLSLTPSSPSVLPQLAHTPFAGRTAQLMFFRVCQTVSRAAALFSSPPCRLRDASSTGVASAPRYKPQPRRSAVGRPSRPCRVLPEIHGSTDWGRLVFDRGRRFLIYISYCLSLRQNSEKESATRPRSRSHRNLTTTHFFVGVFNLFHTHQKHARGWLKVAVQAKAKLNREQRQPIK